MANESGEKSGVPKSKGGGLPAAVKQQPAVLRLSDAAVAFGRKLSESEAGPIADRLATKGNVAYALVASPDIRDSTTFMLHVEDFDLYGKALASFTAYVGETVVGAGGWFDKFTGDGALVFWLSGRGLG